MHLNVRALDREGEREKTLADLYARTYRPIDTWRQELCRISSETDPTQWRLFFKTHKQ